MEVISFVNMKGGVAKTTLAVNVADCLVRRHDARVLLVDLDPQFNATQSLVSGQEYVDSLNEGKHTVVQVFDDLTRPVASVVTGAGVASPVSIEDVQPWEIRPGLDLLPGHLELYRLEMGGGQGRENRLRRYLELIGTAREYDYVIVDTPPTPSAWMSSALIASDHFVVPVKPEPLSTTGIDLLRAVVARVKENYGLTIACAGVALTIAETNTVVYRKTIEFLDGNAYWRNYRFRNVLPKRTAVARMQGEQQLILDSGDSDLLLGLTGITDEMLSAIGSNRDT